MAKATGKLADFPELAAIAKASSKKFGKDMTGESYESAEPIATGSLALDIALRIMGLARGRVCEFFGWEASGKTSMALLIIAQAQQIRREQGIEKLDLIIDVEHSMYQEFLEGFGIDYDQVIHLRPDTAEEALQVAIDYPKSGQIDMVLLDSVDALQNERQLSRSVGETDVGGISKDMSRALREVSKLCTKHDTTYIFINQLRMNPGQMMGNPKVTPGGNALKFYSTMRLEFMNGRESTNVKGALGMRIKIIKNKCGAPWGKDPVEIDFYYAKGPDKYLDLINVGKHYKILRQAGPAGQELVEGTYQSISTGGTNGLVSYFQENPDEFNRIKERILVAAGVKDEPDTRREDSDDQQGAEETTSPAA